MLSYSRVSVCLVGSIYLKAFYHKMYLSKMYIQSFLTQGGKALETEVKYSTELQFFITGFLKEPKKKTCQRLSSAPQTSLQTVGLN